jgi:hypothetical protein
MILAIILLSGLRNSGMAPSWGTSQQSPSAPASNSSANGGSTQGASQQSSSSPSSGNTAKPAATHPTTHARKKKIVQTDCNATTAPASGTVAKNASASSGPSPNTTAQSAPVNCPPKKKIVPLGGTSEPSIQLEGGAVGEQASHEKDSTNQMLGVTEQNLKKLEGRQLTSDQKNMVSQARQFMDQAKSAMNSGDLDRARTLAQKAQLLSEDLIKPENP